MENLVQYVCVFITMCRGRIYYSWFACRASFSAGEVMLLLFPLSSHVVQ
jgi:hypothetical protein